MRLKKEQYEKILQEKKESCGSVTKLLETTSCCPIGSLYFEQWLLQEFSQENLYCLKEIQVFEELKGDEKRDFVDYIYINYLKKDSPHEVNIKGKSINIFLEQKEALDKGDISVFDKIFDRIKEDMIDNLFEPFQRFLMDMNSSNEYLSICGDDAYMDIVYKNIVHSTKTISLNNMIKFTIEVINPVKVSEKLAKMMQNVFEEALIHISGSKNLKTFQSRSFDFLTEKKKIQGIKNSRFTYSDMEEEYISKYSDDILQFSRKSDLYNIFIQSILELQGIVLEKMNKDEKVAFFINIYNILSLHILIERNSLSNTLIESKVTSKTFGYQIGEFFFSLDMTKRGILLGNNPDWLQKREITDPKQKKHIIDPSPWRSIACLLTLTTKSPKFKIYHEKDIEDQIAQQFTEYIKKNSMVISKKLILPQCFKDLQFKSKNLQSLMGFFIKEEFSSIMYDQNDKKENLFEFLF